VDGRFDEDVAERHLRFQMRSMTEDFPTLKPLVDRSWLMIWEGGVTPIGRTYVVRVSYMQGVRTADLHWVYRPPEVHVLEPPLTRRPEAPAERIPHVYREAHPAQLCLWYPGSKEWTVAMPISRTFIPWACEWLARYEMWLATGEWTGPAEHPPDGGRLPPPSVQANPREQSNAQGHLGLNLALPLLSSMGYILRHQSTK
jgi:hypothetical protein